MQPGETLRNGATVLHSREAFGHRDLVVLAIFGNEFATWNVREGETFWGHYFDNLLEAVEDFKLRTAEDDLIESVRVGA